MWYFSMIPQSKMQFNFENILHEVDVNEEDEQQHIFEGLSEKDKKGYHAIVCKNWITTHCESGNHCLYLHELDRDKMEECFFWKKSHECSNFACIFKHDLTKPPEGPCSYYIRGFCRHGNKCHKKHTLKDSVCLNYLAGFCPDGPHCLFAHPKWTDEQKDAN